MSTWTKADLVRQLHGSKTLVFPPHGSLYSILQGAAKAHGLPFELVLAVGSRETNLSEPYVSQRAGDGGHGHGPLQLDNRSHVIPAGWHQDPSLVVNPCCTLLALLVGWAAHKYPRLAQSDQTKIALAAYNAGEGAAVRGHNAGNADKYDTGHDYGADTLRRMAVFAELIQG